MRWSIIRRLAHSNYARLAVLVPLIGWLLFINDFALSLLSNYLRLENVPEIPWQIYSFHIGLSIFGIGVAVFYLSSPTEILKFEHASDFVFDELKTVSIERIERYVSLSKVSSLVTAPPSLAEPADPLTSRNVWLDRNKGEILRVLEEYYLYKDASSRRWLIYLTLITLAVGGILTMIPSFVTLSRSICKLWSMI